MTRLTELTMEAFRRGITPPAPATLARYGITAEEWLAQLESQDWCCPICDKTGADVKWNIDHEHVRGWEKMKAKDKKRYWRGILCAYDNYRRVHSSNSAAVTRRILDYLEAYEKRRDA
jgi:hypothetical protein